MLEVCSGVTNEREKDGGARGPVGVGLQTKGRKMGGARGPVGLRSEGPRVTGAPLCAKCSSVCSRFEPSGSVVVC